MEFNNLTQTRGELRPFDFHIHSIMSDGTEFPKDIVYTAKNSGVNLIALTDHDTLDGVSEAQKAGKECGVCVISGVEIDTEFDCELHIIGLSIDINNKDMVSLLEQARVQRNLRNERIVKKLENANIPVSKYLDLSKEGTVTRLNIAKAIMEFGLATTFSEAFEKYLNKGTVGYVFNERTDKLKAIEVIHKAGGFAVLAHPCKLKCDENALISTLKSNGLDALEVYYPTATEGQVEQMLSLAKRYSLFVSSGSDFHGKNRKKATLGCAYRDVDCLNEFADMVYKKQESL